MGRRVPLKAVSIIGIGVLLFVGLYLLLFSVNLGADSGGTGYIIPTAEAQVCSGTETYSCIVWGCSVTPTGYSCFEDRTVTATTQCDDYFDDGNCIAPIEVSTDCTVTASGCSYQSCVNAWRTCSGSGGGGATTHTIDLRSTPTTGVSVSTSEGSCTTNCSKSTTKDYNGDFNITAPGSVFQGSASYNFKQWNIDGIIRTSRSTNISLNDTYSNRVATAEYTAICGITFRSSGGPTGVNITHEAGSGNTTFTYRTATKYNGNFTISAPATVTQSGTTYDFVQWDIDGFIRTSRTTDISLNDSYCSRNATVDYQARNAAVNATITASPTTINSGQSSTINWSSSGATSCSVSPTGWTGTSGSRSTGPLTSSRTYSVSCTGPGGSDGASVTVTVLPVTSPTVDIKANNSDGPITIAYNTSATISWSSSNASSCTVSPNNWTGTSGSRSTGNLTSSRTYSVSCDGGAATDSVTVNVSGAPPPGTVDIQANNSDGPITIAYNTSATISWDSNGVSSCSVSPSGWTGTSGSRSTGNLTSNRTYSISCDGGSAVDSVTVNVGAPPPPPGTPTVDIRANGSDGPITIPSGTSATISWTSQDVSSCSVSPGGWGGTSGSRSTGNLTSSRTYSISCDGGVVTDSVTVNVSAVPPPPPPGTVDIEANGNDGSITIAYDTSATISWSSNGVSSCTVSPNGWTGTSGSRSTGNLTSSRTYSVSCDGGAATDSVTVNVSGAPLPPPPSPAPSVSITANGSGGSTNIAYNTSATIRWSSSNASSCSVSPTGWTGTSGTQSTGNLTSDRTYTVSCTGPGGFDSDRVDVNVAPPPPTVNISASPSSIIRNAGSATLSWTSSGATSCSINAGIGSVPTSGSRSVSPLTTTTYRLTCSNSSGSTSDSTTVTVIVPPPEITSFTATPAVVFRGGQTTLAWSVENIIPGDAGCSASASPAQSDWSGSVPPPPGSSGSKVTSPTETVTYTLTCTNPGGTDTASVTVTVPFLQEVLP